VAWRFVAFAAAVALVPKVDIGAPAPGLPDPPNPPYIAALNLTPPPHAGGPHPRLLFGRSDLPAMRARVADPTREPARSLHRVEGYVPMTAAPPASTSVYGFQAAAQVAELGLAWLLTGDRRQLDLAVGDLHLLEGEFPFYDNPLVNDLGDYYNNRASNLAAFAMTYDVLYNDLAAADRSMLETMIGALATEQMAQSLTAFWGTASSGSNFTGHNGAALGLAGLALWGTAAGAAAPAWVARGRQLVESYAVDGFDPGGAALEGVVYGTFGLRLPTYFGAALERAGAANPLYLGGVPNVPRWMVDEALPGGRFNALNDSRYGNLNTEYITWAATHGPYQDDATWVVEGHLPNSDRGDTDPFADALWFPPAGPTPDPSASTPTTDVFARRGLFNVRTGWAAGDLLASFEERQADFGEGVHRQQDVGNFTLYANGARLAIDSGYANYLAEVTGLRSTATSSTQGHNAIVADGRSQDFLGKGALTAHATTAVLSDPGAIDVAAGDARRAYVALQPERADRYFLVVRAGDGRPAYVVVADAFRQGGGRHTYDWYLHTDGPNRVTRLVSMPTGAQARIAAPNGAGLNVDMISTLPLRAGQDTFVPEESDPGPHPRLAFEGKGAEFDSIAVLTPVAKGASGPTVGPTAGSLGARVDWPAGRDLVSLRGMADGLTVDGAFGFVRTTADGRVGPLALVAGRSLTDGRRPLVTVRGAPATVVTSPQRVVVEGEGVTGFSVVAPGTSIAWLNGTLIAVSVCGDVIIYPATGCVVHRSTHLTRHRW
jgi:heparinase II/III-like protein